MRLVIVSNRLPFMVSVNEGQPQFKASAGGLATGSTSHPGRQAPEGFERPDMVWPDGPQKFSTAFSTAVSKH